MLTVKRREAVFSISQLFTCLMGRVVLGIERLRHAHVLAGDRPIRKILGLRRFPSGTTLWRFLLGMKMGHGNFIKASSKWRP